MTRSAGRTVHADDTATWDAFVADARSGFVPPALGVGPGQGRQRLVGGPAAQRTTAPTAPSARQVLLRRPRPLPWAFAYAPRGPVAAAGRWTAPRTPSAAFTEACRTTLRERAGRVSHLRIDPEIERDGPADEDGAVRRALRAAGWRPAPPIQPNATRIIDLAADEEALWGDLRKKWRQYVNKARSAGVTVVDAEGDALAEFYRIYRETADRAGFLIRTEQAYRDVWEAFAPHRQRPAAVRPTAGRRGARDAVPRPVRDARRRAVRRDDRRRRRVAGELPPEMGGDPDVARAGRHELRPVGPRDRRDRPLQDRLRGARGPATSGRGTSSSTRSAGRSTSAAQAARVWWARRRHGLSGEGSASAYAGYTGGDAA